MEGGGPAVGQRRGSGGAGVVRVCMRAREGARRGERREKRKGEGEEGDVEVGKEDGSQVACGFGAWLGCVPD
jgi:hypothetical protein